MIVSIKDRSIPVSGLQKQFLGKAVLLNAASHKSCCKKYVLCIGMTVLNFVELCTCGKMFENKIRYSVLVSFRIVMDISFCICLNFTNEVRNTSSSVLEIISTSDNVDVRFASICVAKLRSAVI